MALGVKGETRCRLSSATTSKDERLDLGDKEPKIACPGRAGMEKPLAKDTARRYAA